MSENSAKIEWYLARDGQQHGPLSSLELDKFIELGHLKPTDLLWRAGFDDWRTATEVFPPRPPAPPVSAPPIAAPPIETETPSRTATASPGTEQAGFAEPAHPAASAGIPNETTQPVHKINPTDDPRSRPVAGTNTDRADPQFGQQPATHQDPAVAPRSEFGSAPATAGEAGLAHQRSAIRLADPSVRVEPANFGPALAAPNAITQRPQPGGGAGHLDPAHLNHGHPNPRQPVAANRGPAVDDLDDEEFLDDEEGGRSGWLMVAAALFLFVLLGAGGLFAYNNQQQIAALYADIAGKAKVSEVSIVRAPEKAARQPAADNTAPKPLNPPVLASKPLSELPILKSKLWQYAQKEFGDWTNERLAELAQQQGKSKEEANKYLVDAFVRFRRENANHAFVASSDSLEGVASAFVESLRALTSKGPDACYAYISNGENSPELAPLYFEPNIGPKLEAQMLAVLKAVVDGKTTPTTQREPPSNDQFNMLSAELVKLGWSAEDLRLFSDANALSRADPKLVCRLVTQWFSAQAKLGDQAARDQLIAASLRPVIGG